MRLSALSSTPTVTHEIAGWRRRFKGQRRPLTQLRPTGPRVAPPEDKLSSLRSPGLRNPLPRGLRHSHISRGGLAPATHTTVVPGLVPGNHWRRQVAMPQDLCIGGTARALGPGNECRDDSLLCGKGEPLLHAMCESSSPRRGEGHKISSPLAPEHDDRVRPQRQPAQSSAHLSQRVAGAASACFVLHQYPTRQKVGDVAQCGVRRAFLDRRPLG